MNIFWQQDIVGIMKFFCAIIKDKKIKTYAIKIQNLCEQENEDKCYYVEDSF